MASGCPITDQSAGDSSSVSKQSIQRGRTPHVTRRKWSLRLSGGASQTISVSFSRTLIDVALTCTQSKIIWLMCLDCLRRKLLKRSREREDAANMKWPMQSHNAGNELRSQRAWKALHCRRMGCCNRAARRSDAWGAYLTSSRRDLHNCTMSMTTTHYTPLAIALRQYPPCFSHLATSCF